MNPFLFMIYVSSLCDSRCMTCHRSTNVLFLKDEEVEPEKKITRCSLGGTGFVFWS
jgi:hypothetical protein